MVNVGVSRQDWLAIPFAFLFTFTWTAVISIVTLVRFQVSFYRSLHLVSCLKNGITRMLSRFNIKKNMGNGNLPLCQFHDLIWCPPSYHVRKPQPVSILPHLATWYDPRSLRNLTLPFLRRHTEPSSTNKSHKYFQFVSLWIKWESGYLFKSVI